MMPRMMSMSSARPVIRAIRVQLRPGVPGPSRILVMSPVR